MKMRAAEGLYGLWNLLALAAERFKYYKRIELILTQDWLFYVLHFIATGRFSLSAI
jgi:hypothetical protein